jgi:regulator of cell morphogenesis and NO signaling
MISPSDTPFKAVSLIPNSVGLFKRYGIKPSENCTHIDSIAKTHGIDQDFLVQLINSSYVFDSVTGHEFTEHSITVLLDYLERSHKFYLDVYLPEIDQTIEQLRVSSGSSSGAFKLLQVFFRSYKLDLKRHIQYEEKYLIPYAKILNSANQYKMAFPSLVPMTNFYSVQEFLDNHSHHEVELRDVRKALRNYTPPRSERLPYQVLLTKMKGLEVDLHLHSLIEEKVFIPKLAELEIQVKQLKRPLEL